jgi:hypothetical protein
VVVAGAVVVAVAEAVVAAVAEAVVVAVAVAEVKSYPPRCLPHNQFFTNCHSSPPRRTGIQCLLKVFIFTIL